MCSSESFSVFQSNKNNEAGHTPACQCYSNNNTTLITTLLMHKEKII